MTAPAPSASPSERGRIGSFLRSKELLKWVKYSCVSLVGVVTTQVILSLPYHSWHWTSVDANMAAVAISAIPAYLLNRAWVWGKTGSNSLTREIIPFWAFAFAGFVLSTLFVYLVEVHTHVRLPGGRLVTANHIPHGVKVKGQSTLPVRAANLAGFGVLWVARFFVLDKLLFKTGAEEDTLTRLAGDAPLA